jgi:hypothetical protein
MAKSDDDFFGEEEQSATEETKSDKIKIGEKEFSQEELTGLVGLGEKAKELEEKWNTKIERLYPEYTKKTQKLSEYETKLQEYEEEKQRREQETLQNKPELNPEEQAKLIKAELKKYGVVTADEINTYVGNFLAGRDLLENIDDLVTTAKQDGKPTTTREELLTYMDENGIKNPQAAYKLMFETELKEWEKKQIDKLKQPKMEVQEGSTAGGKSPAAVKVTRDNIQELLKAALEE